MSDARKFDHKEIKLQWIPVRNLAVVWQDAQRPFNPAWAKQIAAEFDPDKFNPVKTMLPNGNGIHHICEGQHSVAAVRELWGEDEQVPCLVAPTSDRAAAAEIFLVTNTNRKHVNKVAKFKVSVVAGRKDEVAIDKIVQHWGYRVDGSHAQDCIAAVDALAFVYNKGKQTLDRTLRTLRQTWGGDPAAVSGPLLRSYGAFICEFSSSIDWGRLCDSVKKGLLSPGRLMDQITVFKETAHVTTTEAGVCCLLKIYNKNLRDGLKLRRKEGG